MDNLHISITSMVTREKKRGAVQLSIGEMNVVLSSDDAKKIGHDLIDAAITGQIDASIFSFGQTLAKVDEDRDLDGARLLDQMRQHRIKIEGEK